MILEELAKKKKKYQNKAQYFETINFENLAADFQGVVDLIEEMEQYMKGEKDGENIEN